MRRFAIITRSITEATGLKTLERTIRKKFKKQHMS
jgi:hypothetical protein